MHNVVIDTNVWISGIILGGTASEVLQHIQEKEWKIYISPKIIEEIDRVLGYKKIDKILIKVRKTKFEVLNRIISMCTLVRPNVRIEIIKKDPSDNIFLECAKKCKASCIISGDRHLLALKIFEGIEILSPSKFLQKFL